MSRDYKSLSKSKSKSSKKGSSLFLGLFLGYILGLISAIGVWLYIHQAPSPFIQNDKPIINTKINPSINKSQPLKERKTSDSKNNEIEDANKKPRFEFYEMLPNNEESVTEEQFQKAVKQPSLKDKYYLQVGSFQDTGEAENLKAKIAMLGMEAYVQPADLSEKGMWHRVRIGPFTKTEEISKARASLLLNDIKADLIKIRIENQ
ncbi:MAG: sporulation protein [Nitrosomonadaceae bacterium]|nr:sporulation protein [Nitrosomonadaceae bacterium]|tara:strand:+ start:845 stop:1459 length:615 start_codon:yes stop_codon:yes gene_type:complete